MKRVGIMVSVALLVLLLVAVGCGPQAAPASGGAATGAFEKQWEAIVTAAQKEGKVVFYTTAGEPVRRPLVQAFQEKYGITVEAVTASSGELGARILSERRANLYLYDVFIGASSIAVSSLKPAGAFDPLPPVLALPDLTQPEQIKKTWYGGELPWVDKEQQYLVAFVLFPSSDLAINTSLVKPEELKSYKDILNPKYKGMIAQYDFTISGAGQYWMSLFGSRILGWDYMRELVKQQPNIVKDPRQVVEWLAHGKAAIAIAPRSEIVTEFQRVGAAVVPHHASEGNYVTSGSGTVGLANRAPHPDTAKLFVNWLLSKDGGFAYSKASGNQSGRLDVATDFLDPGRFREPGIKYLNCEKEDILAAIPEHGKYAAQIFASLLK